MGVAQFASELNLHSQKSLFGNSAAAFECLVVGRECARSTERTVEGEGVRKRTLGNLVLCVFLFSVLSLARVPMSLSIMPFAVLRSMMSQIVSKSEQGERPPGPAARIFQAIFFSPLLLFYSFFPGGQAPCSLCSPSRRA